VALTANRLDGILQNFVSSTADVQGAALVSPDGLPLASSLPPGMDEERTSAMSAAILSLGERIGTELSRGEVGRILVEGDNGYSILTGCGSEAVLLVLATQNAKQGMLMLDIKRTVTELKAILN
jgi:predicted regulator of Ras-like GTPase activity (Roadblock/LC7/MglB family)